MTSPEFFSQDGNPTHKWGLIVDTSSANGRLIAISPKGEILKIICWDKELRHSEVLLINFLSIEKELGKGNLKHLFFVQGPGSFTGLRVGASFVKALSFSLEELPISTQTSFLPIANQVIKENSNLNEFHVLIPSIREKYFSARFTKRDGLWVEEVDFRGASEGVISLKNPFSSFDQLTKKDSPVKAVKLSVEVLVDSFFSKKCIKSQATQQTYLDLYPLYLRQSEAEEKNRYDKTKLQQIQKK